MRSRVRGNRSPPATRAGEFDERRHRRGLPAAFSGVLGDLRPAAVTGKEFNDQIAVAGMADDDRAGRQRTAQSRAAAWRRRSLAAVPGVRLAPLLELVGRHFADDFASCVAQAGAVVQGDELVGAEGCGDPGDLAIGEVEHLAALSSRRPEQGDASCRKLCAQAFRIDARPLR